MNKIVSRGLWGVLFVAGLSVLGATAANAAETTGSDGTASGTQGIVSLGTPAVIGGNAISVLGDSTSSNASAASTPAQPTSEASTSGSSTSGLDALASGTQGIISGTIPIGASGNAVSVLGDSTSSDSSTATSTGPAEATDSGASTTGESGTASGTQVAPAVTAPVGISGNAISVLGDSRTSDSTSGGSADSGDPAINESDTTTGEDGTLGGTQIAPAITAPIGLSGNAITILGDSETTGSTTVASPGTPTTPTGPTISPAALGMAPFGTLAETGTESAPAFAMVALALLAGFAMTVVGRIRQRRS